MILPLLASVGWLAPCGAAEIAVPAKGQSALVDKIKANGVLRAGVIVAPPNLLQDPKTGTYFGPSIEIADKLASVLGVPVKLVDTSWDVAVAGLQSDKFDINVAPLFATPKRQAVVDFVNYTKEGMCYFARKGDARLTNVADIDQAGVTLLVQTGTSPAETAKTEFPKATIISKPQPPGGGQFYEDILTKRADVAPLESSFAKVAVANQPDLKIIPPGDECMKNPHDSTPIGVAFNKGDPAFTKLLQEVVEALAPTIEEDLQKYSTPEFMKE